MHSTTLAFLTGLVISLATAPVLALAMRALWAARNEASRYRARLSEMGSQIHRLSADLSRQRQIREIERENHRQSLEQLMQDCDERIAAYARRTNPFSEEDLGHLHAIAGKLELAAETFAGLRSADHARQARLESLHASAMADRLQAALAAMRPAPATQQEGVAA